MIAGSDKLRIGMIGLSPGNGHPYSWSAILNGYDPAEMEKSTFPNIANYLKKQKFPEDQLTGGCVTHIWTQDKVLSAHIAKTCHIDHVCDDYTDMIGEIDAVLLARDDAETHYEMAVPFLDAGLPVYIDKPLATERRTAEKIYGHEKYEGQVFTCSSLRYSNDLHLTAAEKDSVGRLQRISGETPKSWEKYAVHIIEPAMAYIDGGFDTGRVETDKVGDCTALEITWDNGLVTSFKALGNSVKQAPITLTFHGDGGFIVKTFGDSFFSFKQGLAAFLQSVREKRRVIPKDETLKVIDIIELGL